MAAVDPARDEGTYYEISRFPNRFQKPCAGDVTATYTILPDGHIRVGKLAYRQAVEVARGNGYDVSRLVKSGQGS